MPFMYILKSKNYQKTYVGSTTNITRRLKEYNSGKSSYPGRYLRWFVVYKEEFKNLPDARKREKYFKSAAGRKLMKKIIGPLA